MFVFRADFCELKLVIIIWNKMVMDIVCVCVCVCVQDRLVRGVTTYFSGSERVEDILGVQTLGSD